MTQAISKIVVGVDFSENSSRALDTAIEMASKLGASIDLVHAFNGMVPMVYPYEVAIPDALLRDIRNAAKAKLMEDQERVNAASVEVRTHLVEVPAHSAIIEVAEDVGADLLIMGTRGNTGLKHVFMGSVAERTVRHAPCSVLVVK